MEIVTVVIGGIVSLTVSILGGLVVAKVNRQATKIAEFEKAITTLQNTAVNDSHVRRIVKEELEPISSTINKLADSMHNVETFVAEERGFKAGLVAALKDTKKN